MRVCVDWKKLGVAGGKTVVDLATGQYPAAVKSMIDVAGALGWKGLAPPNAEEGARLLVERALLSAILNTFRAHMVTGAPLTTTADPREIEASLAGIAGGAEFELDSNTFDNPAAWPIVDAVCEEFAKWLAHCGVPGKLHDPMTRYLRAEIPIAVRTEFRRDTTDYAALRAALVPVPGQDGAGRETRWRDHRARLVEHARAPLFRLDEDKLSPVSLADVYIPLRAWVAESEGEVDHRGYEVREKSAKRRVVWLGEAIRAWIDKKDPLDAVRVVRGEPGAGKSSFVKILAAELARENRRVLAVPMGNLDYRGDAPTAVRNWIKHVDVLGFDPLDDTLLDSADPLILILDGLDELARAGESAETVVGGFVTALVDFVHAINHGKPRILLMLAGRPGAAGATRARVNAESARLEVLRYAFHSSDDTWIIDDPALSADQRDTWWARYGRLSGAGWTGVPKVVADGGRGLGDLTAQPALNYLLAQVLVLEGVDKATTIAGRHELYTRFFDHVVRRVHRTRGDPNESFDSPIVRDRLDRILEETAIAAWHSGDRAVKREDLRAHFEREDLIDTFNEAFRSGEGGDGFDKGVVGVLDSFYCSPGDGPSRTFVFTHKSFREFLTARRIVREVRDASRKLGEHPSKRDVADALARWMDVCGPTAMDRDLLGVLRAAVADPQESAAAVAEWRRTMTRLFQECVSPGPKLSTVTTAREIERRVLNAEVAVLAALNACVLRTRADGDKNHVPADWSDVSAGETLHRLLGSASEPTILWLCLSCIDMSGADLYNANLSGANLSGANLSGANLSAANLSGASLSGANLYYANLSDANLSDAKLSGANMFFANLSGANLSAADLSAANLSAASLSGANLSGANIFFASLSGADLSGANLSGATMPDGKKHRPPRKRKAKTP